MSRAASLRKKATDCERILWRRLGNRNFARYKFRRQHPIDPYILDFYCPAAKLAIELDGGGHNYQMRRIRDQKRAEFLARRRIKLLRFWNHQVRQELDSVLQAIWFALEEHSKLQTLTLPSPLPRERRPIRAHADGALGANRGAPRVRLNPPLPDCGERIEVRGPHRVRLRNVPCRQSAASVSSRGHRCAPLAPNERTRSHL